MTRSISSLPTTVQQKISQVNWKKIFPECIIRQYANTSTLEIMVKGIDMLDRFACAFFFI